MKPKIHFDDVSKLYQLGLTRTSLPSLLSQRVKRSLRKDGGQKAGSGEFWAVKNVSFELREGESLALVGRNGAGKTTMLKLLANITKPTSGNIDIFGQLSALIELGAGFHPDLTGRENIYLNGTILGISRRDIDRRFDEIVDFSELGHFIDTPVKRYSSGMTVRLGFAVASCIEPEILLVDEVLAVGDASFQQKCMERIRELLLNGTSIVFVSHNIYLVQAVCERALYLEHGQVKLAGSTQDVINRYEQDLHNERALKLAQGEDFDKGEEAGDIDITHVEVVRVSDQADDNVIDSDEAIRIDVHYDAFQPLGKTHVSVFINRSDGLTCCMMRTKLDDFNLVVGRGHGVVSVTLDPLQLVTGAYFVEAWFLNNSDSMVVTPKPGRSDWFNVRGRGISDLDTGGIFEPHTQWAFMEDNGYNMPDARLASGDVTANDVGHGAIHSFD